MKKYVAYYRVSTPKQGESGLGLEAQKAAVKLFLQGSPIETEFIEVESGKKNNRLQLEAAIARAKLTGATLVIAKLDRLSRNAAFIFTLKDSGVDFVCADMPDAHTLTIGIFAVLAQHERELISSRTRAALKAKKEQGYELGKPANLTTAGRLKGAAVGRSKALNSRENKQATHLILGERAKGASFQKIAEILNTLGYATSRGNRFAPGSVHLLYKRTLEETREPAESGHSLLLNFAS